MIRLAAAVCAAVALAPIAGAAADSGNNQSPLVLCRDADYADLHPTLCPGFSLGGGRGGGGAGGGGGLLGGIPVVGGLLKGLGL